MPKSEPTTRSPRELVILGRQCGKTRLTSIVTAGHFAPTDPVAREAYFAQLEAIWDETGGRDANPS